MIKQYPRLGEAYRLYDQCRSRQLVIREVPKPGGKGQEVRMVNMPTGLNVLPYSGGLMDQPAYLVDAFAQFIAAERAVAMKQLSKGSGATFGFDSRDP